MKRYFIWENTKLNLHMLVYNWILMLYMHGVTIIQITLNQSKTEYTYIHFSYREHLGKFLKTWEQKYLKNR